MNRAIIFFAMALASLPAAGSAAASDRNIRMQAPEGLTQLNREGNPLGVGDELKGQSLTLSGNTSDCSRNDCLWNYSLEVELRPLEEEFTGSATHRSLSMARGRNDCSETPYPPLTAAGLLHGTAYKWQAREKAVVYEAAYVEQTLSCVNPETHYSRWVIFGREDAPSFVIAPLVVKTTKAPTSVAMLQGSGSDGTENRLNLNDDRYYRVWATVQAPYTTAWYAGFTGMDAGVRNLTVSYSGYNSQRCDQSLHIWDWRLEVWTALNARQAGNEEAVMEEVIPAGDLANYLSGTGELKIRVLCSSDLLTFSSNGNSLMLSFDQPLSPAR